MKPIKSSHAFTLAELMIAALIVSATIAGIMQLSIGSSLLAENSKNLAYVLVEAQDKMTEIESSDYDNIVTTYNAANFNLDYPEGATGSITVSQVGSEVASELLQITITVAWQNRVGRTLNQTLTALIANK